MGNEIRISRQANADSAQTYWHQPQKTIAIDLQVNRNQTFRIRNLQYLPLFLNPPDKREISMSIKITSLVWECYSLKARQKIVLLCLADSANDDGVTFVSGKYLSGKCQMSEVSINNAISSLTQCNLLSKIDNRYQINIEAIKKMSVE